MPNITTATANPPYSENNKSVQAPLTYGMQKIWTKTIVISARILKEMHSLIAVILKVIFDCSHNNGAIPNDWKGANVTPLFKKGNRLQTSNYRSFL